MQVTPADIQVISRLVSDLCGVVLDASKGYLIESRLSRIAESNGCKTFTELYYKARYDNNTTLRGAIIDAITTQETLFFRDTSPFEALQYKALPELFDAKARTATPRRVRIWSAACSTGQEPYSLAILFHELLPDVANWDIKITATDISDAAIAQASRGTYVEMEIKRGMRPEILQKYFTRVGNAWRARDELRALIAFRRLNLLEPFAGQGPFDIIFCRNVAIYFSPDARRSLFERLARELAPAGYMFVGGSESLSDLGPRFAPQQHCRAVFYQPNRLPLTATANRAAPSPVPAAR